MIPKVIHYCWFGGNPKSEIINNCINSWREFCPEYEIIEWNETNFDVNSIPYIKKAYEEKKWAFVSDFARLWIIYHKGGIYLDTDVLLHKSLDELTKYDCWLASEDVRYVATGLGFGAVKEHFLIKNMMEAYYSLLFPASTCVAIDTASVEKTLTQWEKSEQSQILNNFLIIGINDYAKFSKNFYTYSLGNEEERKKRQKEILKGPLKGIKLLVWKFKCLVRHPRIIVYLDKRKGSLFEKTYTFFAYDFLEKGFFYYIKRLFMKLFQKK